MEPSKKCTKCQVVKPLSDFTMMAKNLKDGRQPRCRACAAAWYQANKHLHVENVRMRNKKHRKLLWQKLTEYLLAHPCVDCGQTDLRTLEFDHRDASAKRENIGRMLGNSLPWRRILEEIEKCDVRCCNCHRIRTGEQFGSWRVGAEAARAAVLAEQDQQVRTDAVARLARILPRSSADDVTSVGS